MTSKEKIISVSLELFIQNGVHGTSTKMISEKAEVSNGSLFHHFSNKDEILVEIYKNLYNDFIFCLYEAVKDKTTLRSFAYAYFEIGVKWKMKNSRENLFINMFSMQPSVQKCEEYLDEKTYQYFANRITSFIEEGDLVSINYNAFLYNIGSAINGVVQYLTKYSDTNIDWFIELSFKQYFRSIVNF